MVPPSDLLKPDHLLMVCLYTTTIQIDYGDMIMNAIRLVH